MTAFWTEPDFDEHEMVQFVHDRKSGLNAIIALHSTHLGPGAGGTRFWHYANPDGALHDALRLSRGMSYKNAMAGLPMGGGKAVVLLDKSRTKTPEMLAAFGDMVEALGGCLSRSRHRGLIAGGKRVIKLRERRTPAHFALLAKRLVQQARARAVPA